ncbi:conjugative transposon protein TraN [Ferruginibacter paludis]|uniref:conjugative transposon protein TraN n=1 Tax=Ferruginibacter paludis TaxID=1310417 RepID=UPI0025B3D222|nr:conjugative transposon protein TraN [Ferruginibacter paludis]MDN3654132.1 conjugative transposon protein TraN [Ferruginibacter paludis]
MKRLVWLALTSLFFVSLKAQTSLCISTEKTTSLVFPFSILHVDRGTQAILAQQVKESPTILLVKAAEKGFPETNLSVVTDDGSVYSFVVCYDNNPANWVYHLPTNKFATLATYANGILDNPRTMHGIKDEQWDIKAMVSGIYIKNEIMYYQLNITNNSPVDYDIDVLRFFIRDKKKGKRTAIQETDLKPLHISGNTSQVKANSTSSMVFALDKFTIPDAKYLAVQIMEKNGGRHLSLKVSNKKIMQAIILPDLK